MDTQQEFDARVKALSYALRFYESVNDGLTRNGQSPWIPAEEEQWIEKRAEGFYQFLIGKYNPTPTTKAA